MRLKKIHGYEEANHFLADQYLALESTEFQGVR
jgi:hypothetical protein